MTASKHQPGCCCGGGDACNIDADAFDRANENPVTGWDVLSGTAQVVSNRVKLSSGRILIDGAAANYLQFCKVDWYSTSAPYDENPNLILNSTDDAEDCYFVDIQPGFFANSTISIKKRVGGSVSTMVTKSVAYQFPSSGNPHTISLCLHPSDSVLNILTATIVSADGNEELMTATGASAVPITGGYRAGIAAVSSTVDFDGFYFGVSGETGTDDPCNKCGAYHYTCAPCEYTLPQVPIRIDFGSGTPTDNGSSIPSRRSPVSPSLASPCNSTLCSRATGTVTIPAEYSPVPCRWYACFDEDCVIDVGLEVNLYAHIIAMNIVLDAGVYYFIVALTGFNGTCPLIGSENNWRAASWKIEIDEPDCADMFPAVLSIDENNCSGVPSTITVSLVE